MKMKLFLASLIIGSTLFITSCNKDDDTPPPSVDGFWVGKYSLGVGDPTEFFAYLFRNNGTVRVYADGVDTVSAISNEGTYTFVNGVVETTYAGVKTKATVNPSINFMQGTWGVAPSNSNSGNIALTKQ